MEEMDTPSPVAKFAKIVYDDINNGCASRKIEPAQWKKHFELHHTDSAVYLIELLQAAYLEYALSRRDTRNIL